MKTNINKLMRLARKMNLNIQGVPEVMGQTLTGGRGHHKDSELHSNPWSETSWEGSMTGTRDEETQD